MASPAVRSWFEMEPDRPKVLDAFLLGDLVVVACSFVSAAAILRRSRRAPFVLALTAGCMGYATSLLLGWLLLGGDGWIGAVLMLPATGVTAWLAFDTATRR